MHPSLAQIRDAQSVVYRPMAPQYRWPLLERRLGTEVWVKRENHTAWGAGAAGLAGALIEKDTLQGKRIGIALIGGNVDRETFAAVLAGTFSRSRVG